MRTTELTTGFPLAIDGLESSLNSLKIDSTKKYPGSSKSKSVAESWEDDSDSPPYASPSGGPSLLQPRDIPHSKAQHAESSSHKRSPSDLPCAPPPTPISPGFSHNPTRGLQPYTSLADRFGGLDEDDDSSSRASSRPSSSSARPEKTNATASRMIANGLGVRNPKRTEDENRYDKAARENERKRVENERRQKREFQQKKEQAQKDVWDG